MLVVTSSDRRGYRKFGKNMLQTLNENCVLPVTVYTEDEITFPNATTKQLKDVPGWESFQEDTKDFTPEFYLFQAKKFSHKVYAQLDAFKSRHRYIVWLDMDILVTAEVTEGFLKGLVEDHFCAYLGRKESHTESGFLIFDTKHPDFLAFVEIYAAQYNERKLFLLEYWTDCHAFDHARDGLKANNLTPDAEGICDVFSKSPLKDLMIHNKGALKHE